MKVKLIGLGSADPAALTAQARDALEKAEYIIGAERLLRGIESKAEKIAAVKTEDILGLIKSCGRENICAVFSGDTGFYSGAKKLRAALLEAGIECEVLPGLSSVQLLAAAIGEPWQGWKLVSAHGENCDTVNAVCGGKDCFFLTSGGKAPAEICRELCDAGLGKLSVIVGERLGTEDERIIRGTAEEIAGMEFAALNVMLCRAAEVLPRRTPGIADDEFIRDKVPMTKQEVRAAILAKLAIRETDICWDVGAGTGSVSIELALNSAAVYAVEEKSDACALIKQNREKFCAWKLRLVAGRAPEALHTLPAPDAVFIGGSGGMLREIMAAALEKNPRARICVSAIALETLNSAMQCMQDFGLEFEVSQIAVSRAKGVGALHLLMAQNPVFLITGSKAI